jgi:hypothetical protein
LASANCAINVFVNCPFDGTYTPLMEALVFAIHDCGYIARSALEAEDSAEVRMDKIAKIIKDCRYGIHDISRTEAGADTGLPRFNMPLELGLFLGARRFGSRIDKLKACLILDRARYRYQQFCSDIAGQDICQRLRLERNELIFNDYTTLIAAWLSENAWWDGEEERSTS